MSKVIYTKAVLEDAVKQSSNFTEAFRLLGARIGGNTYQRVRKLIDDFGIDTSHFCAARSAGIIAARLAEPKSWQERLVNGYDRRLDSKRIRRALQDSGRPYVCEKCGQGPTWNEEKLTLHVDHIDGNWKDCRPKNLRFLCPNCHSQADTSCNQHMTKRCSNCRKKITKESTMCRRCNNTVRSRPRKVEVRPTLDVLLRDVEELGYCGTGRKYGVTDNAIRQWIRKAENGQ